MTNLIFGFHDMDFIEQFLLFIIQSFNPVSPQSLIIIPNTLLSSALASIPPSARWNIVFCIVSYPFACCFSPLCIYESANPPADYSYHTLLNKYTEQLLQNHTMERKKSSFISVFTYPVSRQSLSHNPPPPLLQRSHHTARQYPE